MASHVVSGRRPNLRPNWMAVVTDNWLSLHIMRLRLCSLLFTSLPLLALASAADQIVLPNADSQMADLPIRLHTKPTLADLLTIESTASIFYSYARELELSSMFSQDTEHGGQMLTLLVPTNKAVMALARKPWVNSYLGYSYGCYSVFTAISNRHQGPAPLEPEIEISEQEIDSLRKKNVERWVSAHIIPVHFSPLFLPLSTYIDFWNWQRSPIPLVSRTYDTLLSGKSVTFQSVEGGDESKPEWTRVLVEGESSIVGMKEVCVFMTFFQLWNLTIWVHCALTLQASNGVLYLVDGTVKVDWSMNGHRWTVPKYTIWATAMYYALISVQPLFFF